MIEWLTERLMKWCEKTGRVLKITGESTDPNDVYLIRYYVIRSKYFNFFIHQFLRSDRSDLHDHPWNFCTYLVRGAYTENKWNEKLNKIEQVRRVNWSQSIAINVNNKDGPFPLKPYRINTLVFRKSTDQHQVVVDKDLTEKRKDEAALTVCLTGPIKRDWGFWTERDPKSTVEELELIDVWSGKVREWVHWKKYLGVSEDAPGRG